LHMAHLMPLLLTVFSEIQIGFTFLVPAHPGSPGHRAVKRVCVYVCVRACVCDGLSRTFVINWYFSVPPHLKHATILPCEISMSKKSSSSSSN